MQKTLLACCVLACGALSACSTRPWYEGLRQSGAQACRQQPGQPSEPCSPGHYDKPYEAYERERSQLKP